MSDATVSIIGLFLAAGRGRRFGSNKLLHLIEGRPLVSYGVQAALASTLPEVRIVVGPGDDPVRAMLNPRVAEEDRLTFVENSNPELGMMSSLQAGLCTLPPSVGGVMLFLGDMPFVNPATIDRLLGLFERGRMVIPLCAGRLLHPRILPRELFAEFHALAPNASGQVVLERHPNRILQVPFTDESCFEDIDRPEDLPDDTP